MELFTTKGSERVLSEKAFLISETDEKGIIVFANDDFCTIADYNVDELIGKAHNIVRHPEMPRAAFKDLWDTINRGEVWTGFVKNKTKSGTQFYWVFATVYPVMRDGKRHYISCRRKPTADEIEGAVALYKTLH
jgi:PAS domain S-box-containing protein